jgi:DNA-binding CsgD family transcriptional regulator
MDPSYIRSYDEHWACRNFLWKSSVVLPVGELFSFETAMPRDQFVRTGLYNEWFHPQGMDKALGANILVEGPLPAVASVYRPSSDPDFTDRDVARFRSLLPHLQRAWQLRTRLHNGSCRGDDVRAVVAAIEKPAILVDREATVLCANGAGAATIRDRSLILDRKGRLSTSKPDETGSLKKLIHTATMRNSSVAGGKMVARRENRTSVVLLVSPLPGARFAGQDQIAIIFIDDPERKQRISPNTDLLRSQFQLTHAEAALASLMLRGSNLHQAATQSDVSVSTARTHLSRIFQKTDTHSQSALLRLLGKAGYHD